MHKVKIDDSDSLRLIVEAIEKILPSINRKKEELEQEASKLEYTPGETLKSFFKQREDLYSELNMQNIRTEEYEDRFIELML